MTDRRTRTGDRDGGTGRPWWASAAGEDGDDAAGDSRDARSRQAPPGGEHRHDPRGTDATCQVCPVCSLLRVVGEARPEVLEHLTEAARHLTLAAKAIVDAQAEQFRRRDDGLQRIDLDED